MGETVRKYKYIEKEHMGEYESWLTDMAAEGLHLQKESPEHAYFERGVAQNMRYRLDILPPCDYFGEEEQRQNEELKQLYKEAGWEFVCGDSKIQVFRSPEELNAPELHADRAEQVMAIQEMERKVVRRSILFLILTTAICLMAGYTVFAGITSTPMLSLVRGHINIKLLALLHLTYICIKGAMASFAFSRFSRNLRKGRPIDHRADWRPRRCRWQIARLLLILLTATIICMFFIQIVSLHSETLPLTNSDPTLLRLADIEQDPLLVREPPYMADDVDGLNYAEYEWTPYAKTILKVVENGLVSGSLWLNSSLEYNPYITYEVYQLRFPFMTQGVLKDLCNYYGIFKKLPVTEVSDYPGFDRLLVREEGGYKEVFAAKDGSVIYLRYYGEQPIQQVIMAVGEWLARM